MGKLNSPAQVAIEPFTGRGTSLISGNRFAYAGAPHASGLYEYLRLDEPWGDVVKAVAREISRDAYDHPPVAMFEVSASGTSWFVFGEVDVELEMGNETLQLEATGVSTWVESRTDETVTRVRIGISADPIGTVTEGFVTSGGLVATMLSNDSALNDSQQPARIADHETTIRTAPKPVQTPGPPTPPVASVQPNRPAETTPPEPPAFDPNATTSVTGAQLHAIKSEAASITNPRRSSARNDTGDPTFVRPTLRGVRCPNGHLNSMQDDRCRTCAAVIDQSGPIESDVRPILAIVTLDDGTVHELDAPMAFGRDVPERYSIGGEVAYAVALADETNLISRVHLEVHLSGWDIELIDKGSSNGSFTREIGSAGAKSRLRPEHPTSIPLGTEVEVGGRRFTITAGTPDSKNS